MSDSALSQTILLRISPAMLGNIDGALDTVLANGPLTSRSRFIRACIAYVLYELEDELK